MREGFAQVELPGVRFFWQPKFLPAEVGHVAGKNRGEGTPPKAAISHSHRAIGKSDESIERLLPLLGASIGVSKGHLQLGVQWASLAFGGHAGSALEQFCSEAVKAHVIAPVIKRVR